MLTNQSPTCFHKVITHTQSCVVSRAVLYNSCSSSPFPPSPPLPPTLPPPSPPVHGYLCTMCRSNAPFTPRVILLGPTGSGKSLQAAQLARKYRLVDSKLPAVYSPVLESPCVFELAIQFTTLWYLLCFCCLFVLFVCAVLFVCCLFVLFVLFVCVVCLCCLFVLFVCLVSLCCLFVLLVLLFLWVDIRV